MNYDDSPIIENVTNDSIQILSNNSAHTIATCVNINTNKMIEKEIVSRKCTFNNLESNVTYLLFTRHENSNSKSIQCKTLSNEENFVNSFKSYVHNNSLLLSSDIENYDSILEKLNDDQDIVYTLSKEKNDKANELIYMAVKYKNEFNRIINEHKLESIPTKNLDNIFGNTFIFNMDALKCNIFSVKNKKEYFVDSEQYPTEITYSNGKANTSYNVMAISDSNMKSPKYTFYNYSENDKAKIEKIYSKSNQLAKIDLSDYAARNTKQPENVLKCLAVKDNKNIDLKLLKAPNVSIDENSNIIFDVNYKDSLGLNEKNYFICISEISECLDKTSFRKLSITDRDEIIFANKYMTAVNTKDIFTIWIEDENYNIISEIAFASTLEDIKNFNVQLVEESIANILSQIESFNVKNNSSDIIYSLANDASLKNLYYELANHLINSNIISLNTSLFELFKIKFNDYYINQDKYKKAYYNQNKNKIEFETHKNGAQLVSVKFKKGYEYSIEVINNTSIILDHDYDYNLLYLIDNNPMIKSGFLLIDNKNNIMSHSIIIEEVK